MNKFMKTIILLSALALTACNSGGSKGGGKGETPAPQPNEQCQTYKVSNVRLMELSDMFISTVESSKDFMQARTSYERMIYLGAYLEESISSTIEEDYGRLMKEQNLILLADLLIDWEALSPRNPTSDELDNIRFCK